MNGGLLLECLLWECLCNDEGEFDRPPLTSNGRKRQAPDTMTVTVPGMDANTTRIEGLDPNTDYIVQVSASNRAGRNDLSHPTLVKSRCL